MPWLTPCPKELLFTKSDPQDPRWGERVDLVETENIHWAQSLHPCCLLGYPDDEGIRLNKGRPGAAEGPNGIRNFLYRMTPSPFLPLDFRISDLGNLNLDLSLQERHERARSLIYNLVKHDNIWISLGGGHDYGYCDTTGFVEACVQNGKKPLVVNFDAHLDVRDTSKGLNSGTPFYRLLEKWSDHCFFVEVGIQPQCNSRHHYQYLLDHGGLALSLDQVREQDPLQLISQRFLLNQETPTFVSLDIDVFSSSEAPGCSQSWPWGLSTSEFFPLMKWFLQHVDVRGLGVYEVSPPLDVNDNTQRLAALAVYEFINQKMLALTLQRGKD